MKFQRDEDGGNRLSDNAKRKICIGLAALLLLQLCLPIVAAGASVFKIYYDAATGNVSGVIYTDRPTVNLSVYDDETADITDSVVGEAQSTERENLYFFDVEGNIGAGRSLDELIVSAGDETEAAPTVNGDVYEFVKHKSLTPPDFYYDGSRYHNGTFDYHLSWYQPYLSFSFSHYNLYLDGEKVGETRNQSYVIEGLPPFSRPEIAISVVDVLGFESPESTITADIPGVFDGVYFSGKPKGYTFQPGDKLASFTPRLGPSEDVWDQTTELRISLEGIWDPVRYEYLNWEARTGQLSVNDFVILTSDGTEVPIQEFSHNQGYSLKFTFDRWLESDETYTIQFSPTSSGNELSLPDGNSRSLRISAYLTDNRTANNGNNFLSENYVIGDPFPPEKPTGLKAVEGDGKLDVSWNANTEDDLAGYIVYLDGERLTDEPIRTTSYRIDGLTNGKTYHVNVAAVDREGNRSLQAYVWPTPKEDASTGGGGGGGGGPRPVLPTSQEEGVRAIPETAIVSDANRATVALEPGDRGVLLPANAAALTGDRPLAIQGERLSAEIPGALLRQLLASVPEDQRKNAAISFRFAPVGGEAQASLLGTVREASPGAGISLAGDIYEFHLSIRTEQGQDIAPNEFAEPIVLKLKVSETANPALVGLYYIRTDGAIEYVGGDVVDGYLVAEASHFSTYAALEYKKRFEDVPSGHWAHDAVASLAARRVVSGASETEFAPDKRVTRAEFAAFLARALQLSETDAAPFRDVAADDWFADEVAAAAKAGIVGGRGDGSFAPNDWVTREEMVVMLMKARAVKLGVPAPSTDSVQTTSFADDGSVSAWAKASVAEASRRGLVQGYADRTFAPQGTSTRAEAAMLVYGLYRL